VSSQRVPTAVKEESRLKLNAEKYAHTNTKEPIRCFVLTQAANGRDVFGGGKKQVDKRVVSFAALNIHI
jgi:hypothetical protein